jgi:hypothetical protein
LVKVNPLAAAPLHATRAGPCCARSQPLAACRSRQNATTCRFAHPLPLPSLSTTHSSFSSLANRMHQSSAGFTFIVICGGELFTSLCAYMAAAWWEGKTTAWDCVRWATHREGPEQGAASAAGAREAGRRARAGVRFVAAARAWLAPSLAFPLFVSRRAIAQSMAMVGGPARCSRHRRPPPAPLQAAETATALLAARLSFEPSQP